MAMAGYEGKIVGTEERKTTVEVDGKIIDTKEETLYVFRNNVAEVFLMYEDIVLKKYGCFNDFYGEMTCVATAIKDAQEHAQTYKLPLYLTVTHSTSLIKKRKTGKKNYWRKDEDEYEPAGDSFGEQSEVVWKSNCNLPRATVPPEIAAFPAVAAVLKDTPEVVVMRGVAAIFNAPKAGDTVKISDSEDECVVLKSKFLCKCGSDDLDIFIAEDGGGATQAYHCRKCKKVGKFGVRE